VHVSAHRGQLGGEGGAAVFPSELHSRQPAFLVGKGKGSERVLGEAGNVNVVSWKKVLNAQGELELNLGLEHSESSCTALFVLSM